MASQWWADTECFDVTPGGEGANTSIPMETYNLAIFQGGGRGGPSLWIRAYACSMIIQICERWYISYASSLDPDQARRNVGPDLDPSNLKHSRACWGMLILLILFFLFIYLFIFFFFAYWFFFEIVVFKNNEKKGQPSDCVIKGTFSRSVFYMNISYHCSLSVYRQSIYFST